MSELHGFSRVDRALILLSLHVLSRDQVVWLQDFFGGISPGQVVELQAKVALNDVAPQALLNLERYGIDPRLPGAVLAPWRARRDRIQALAARRVAEAASLFSRFADEGIEVILLKGMLFAEVMWRDPAYKKMNDVDVLLRPEDVHDARRIYAERDYLPLILFEGGSPEEIDLERSHHLPSYVSRDLDFVIGTHWALCSPRKGFRLDHARIWGDSFEVPFHGTRVRSMAHEDNLHHLAVHFHHYKTGVKELSDVYDYAAHAAEDLDWDLLERRILAAGTASKAHYLFHLAEAMHPLGAPQSFFLALERAADDFSRREVTLRSERLDLLLSSRSLYESAIEKAYTRYALETRFHHKLYYFLLFFRRLVLPPAWVLQRTNVVDRVTWENYPRLWLRNLVRTGREIGQGLGVAVFLVVCLKGLVELTLSLRHYLFPPVDDPLSRLREAVGGDEDRLQQLMDFLE